METYLPYVATVLCSLISGFVSFYAARRQSKAELEKLQKQHDLDVEKMELEHKYQLELKQKEIENQLGANLVSEVMKMPQVRQQLAQGVRNRGKKR